MTFHAPIVPTFRALTVVGKVLDRDDHGEVYHTIVVDTTLPDRVEVVYHLK